MIVNYVVDEGEEQQRRHVSFRPLLIAPLRSNHFGTRLDSDLHIEHQRNLCHELVTSSVSLLVSCLHRPNLLLILCLKEAKGQVN